MRIIVLAGGEARRLWPLTENFPKSLLNIAGKPVIYHLLDNLVHIPDVEEVIIAVDKNKETYFTERMQQFNVYANPRPRIWAHPLNGNNRPKGPIQKISDTLAKLKPDERDGDFLIVGSDNVFGFPLAEFVAYFRRNKRNCVAVQKSSGGSSVSQFGIATIGHDSELTDLDEKPKHTTVSTACYAFHGKDLALVNEFLSDDQPDGLGDFIKWSLPKTEPLTYLFTQKWFDTGTRSGLIAANSYALSQAIPQEEFTPLLQGSNLIIQPVCIEPDVVVEESTIGPNVYIGHRARISNSRVSNSIVYDQTTLEHCTLDFSVIGEKSKLAGRFQDTIAGPGTHIRIE